MQTTTRSTIEMLQSRATLYSFISSLFSSPDTDRFTELFDAEVQSRILDAGEDLNMSSAVKQIFKAITDYGDVSAIMAEYTSVFGHTLSKKSSPYEMEHLDNSEIFYKTQSLADITGFYKAFGLEVSMNERVDHIGVEAEFMSFLIMKEIVALDRKLEGEKREVVRDTQRDFWRDHFSSWTGKFATGVVQEAGDGVYRRAAAFLHEFNRSELRYFNTELKG